MTAEGLDLRLNVIEKLSSLSPNEVKVFLVLAEKAKHEKATLSSQEIADVCNLTVSCVIESLKNLEGKHDMLTISGGRKRTIQLNSVYFLDSPKPFTYTEEKQDRTTEELEMRIRQLEREVIRVETGDVDNLTPWLKGDEQQFVKEIVGFYGRPLNSLEAYYLGQMIQGFGIPRVKKAFYMRKGNKSPLRSAYAMLQAGAAGKPAKEKESNMPRVFYRDVTEE